MTENNNTITFDAKVREKGGKGDARALRREGRVPAIIYGAGKGELKIAIEQKPLKLAYEKGSFRSKVVTINTGKETIRALPREIQLDPVSDAPIHADFLRVESGTVAKIKVKVHFNNREKSPGLKRGGILNIVRREVEMLCDVEKVPEALEVDLDGTKIGDSIHISHIKLPEGVEPTIKGRDFTIATIAGRAKDEEEAKPAEGAEATAAAGAAPAAAAPAAAPAKKK